MLIQLLEEEEGWTEMIEILQTMANCCVSLITVHMTALDTLIKWNIQEPLDLSVFHQTNYFKIL